MIKLILHQNKWVIGSLGWSFFSGRLVSGEPKGKDPTKISFNFTEIFCQLEDGRVEIFQQLMLSYLAMMEVIKSKDQYNSTPASIRVMFFVKYLLTSTKCSASSTELYRFS